MHNETKQQKGRIIPFERDGDFYLRRGSQRLERNDLIEAISNYWLAQERDPRNIDVQLAIAEVLTEMHRYEQSNKLLFPLLSTKESPAECFFGIACNFLGLQEFTHAHDSLESYLALDPEGEFVPDALDMLDIIEDENALYSMPGIFPKEQREAFSVCTQGRQLLENGQSTEAVKLLEKAADDFPQEQFVRNNLALAYFCEKDYERAMSAVKHVLDEVPSDVQAHCNLLLFMHAAKDTSGVEEALEFLRSVDTDDPQDHNRMAVVYMELGLMEDALKILKRLQNQFPYDEGTLHRMAVCHYELLQYQLAVNCYDKLLKVDPNDTVAAFYRKICRRALEGEPEKVDWLYHYQVPYTELLARVRQINEASRLPREELEHRWHNDKVFRSLLSWSLNLPDINTKRTLLSLVASFGDFEAEQALRHFQLDQMQPDAIKQDVFALLKHMRAQEPYIAYLSGNLLVQNRGQFHFQTGQLPLAYQRALEICVESLQNVRSVNCIITAVELFHQYITQTTPLPKLRTPQVPALAAALEFLSCKQNNEKATKAQIASAYGISLVRLNNALAKLTRGMETP